MVEPTPNCPSAAICRVRSAKTEVVDESIGSITLPGITWRFPVRFGMSS